MVVVGLCALTLLLACTTVDPTDARNEMDEAARVGANGHGASGGNERQHRLACDHDCAKAG